jgi:hypothetical protein
MPVPGKGYTIYLGVPPVWTAILQIAYPSLMTRCIIISTAHTGVGLSAASSPQGHCTKTFSGLFAAIPHAGKRVIKFQYCFKELRGVLPHASYSYSEDPGATKRTLAQAIKNDLFIIESLHFL